MAVPFYPSAFGRFCVSLVGGCLVSCILSSPAPAPRLHPPCLPHSAAGSGRTLRLWVAAAFPPSFPPPPTMGPSFPFIRFHFCTLDSTNVQEGRGVWELGMVGIEGQRGIPGANRGPKEPPLVLMKNNSRKIGCLGMGQAVDWAMI